MTPAVHSLIERLHAAPHQSVVALTGGGTRAVAQLLAVPGASRSILEVIVPYNERALCAFLGHTPLSFCSAETSLALAERAYDRAAWLAPRSDVVGIGGTASLVSDRPKRGPHRLHVTWKSGSGGRSYSIELSKGTRDRAGEEDLASAIILNALAEAFGSGDRLPLPLLPGEELQQVDAPSVALLPADARHVLVRPDGRIEVALQWQGDMALLPGSFNPVHHGHRELARAAERLLNMPVAFELSIDNVDKPALGVEEVRARLAQFAWQAPIWLTRAPTFVQKARLFPGASFVVGVDTAERIIAPRYYGGEAQMLAAMDELRRHGCRFVVGGRCDTAGCFRTLSDLPVPAVCRDLFGEVPQSAFQVDVSSTALRCEGQR